MNHYITQDRVELRQIVRAEQPAARRSPVADDARARVPGGFASDGAVKHVALYAMTGIGAARVGVREVIAN